MQGNLPNSKFYEYLESVYPTRKAVLVADSAVQAQSEHPARQAAADELAGLLSEVADKLSATGRRPKRVFYGGGANAGLIKRRSPKGFVLEPSAPQLLLPDGRLWYYHTRLSPEGIYYDARVDHTRSMHGSIPLAGDRFSFLGAVVHKFNFGYRHSDDTSHSDESADFAYELGAIIGKGGSPEYVDASDAFAEILKTL
jgi:hypothetical protein